ncbi:MAG: VanW family protein [Candidatus Falkowbacteria bacterium]|nr:VanW family protein [Candidatus Falkowbacteria bacterium]
MKNHSARLKIFLYLSLPIAMLLVFLLMLGHLAWAKKYESRIYPGIKIGGISLSGLTKAEAKTKINERADQLEKGGLIFELNNKKISIPGEIIADSSDFTQEAFRINRDLTLEKAFNYGRDNNFFNSFSRWIFGNWHSYDLPSEFNFDSEVLSKALQADFGDQETAKQNAFLKLNNQGELEVTPEKNGLAIDYQQAVEIAKKSLADLSSDPIELKTTVVKPDTSSEDLASLATEAKKISDLAPIKIKSNDYFSSVDKATLISWVKAGGDNKITLDKDKIIAFLNEKLAPRVDQEVKSPRFEMKDGKMSYWQAGEEGRKINPEKSADQIINGIIQGKLREILIETEIIPFVSLETGDVVIKELIGTGHSNFNGSPTNRRTNIAVGAKAVHGLLIKPGEEFSLVKALGEIDEKSGYLPELVIKKNKTVPEFGGGLCQVGTTIFRAALSSGLPITARQNHSYRVSYYEPAGTDAAIYDPQPDVRFMNDTGSYILIQSRIVKNDIYFDFWGVSDGRKATSTKPTIFNITKPEAPKTIITSDLKPGEKKCTEKAHNGADAFFDYTVTYLDGTVKEKRFKSHYVPWQEVCLIGATSTVATSETTTPAVIAN